VSTITFDKASRIFESVVAIEEVNLHVRDKEFVAIVGPSGCGKTTCLRMAAGLDFPSSGEVRVGERKVVAPGPDRAVVFQQFALFPWKSVYDNVDFGLRNKSVPSSQRRDRIAAVLKVMNLEGYERSFPHQLSGGMQQRVAIARAYVLDPAVLLMDEPFGALDAQTRVLMQEELVRLARVNPRTVLFITHGVEEAVYLAARVAIMTRRPGRIKEVMDIRSVREAERWENRTRIEDVMDMESFIHLRTAIWKSLREEKSTEET
jgi:NitT/TauT family transport system ATP-binding protein